MIKCHMQDDAGGQGQAKEDLAARLLEARETLQAYLYVHLRNWHDTEDLFQEISLVIMRKAREQPEIVNFKAWSREIARRTLLDHWKKKKKMPVPFAEADLQALENAWHRMDGAGHFMAERKERLKTCLAKLSADLQRMLRLRYEDDMSMNEIAGELGKKGGTVQVALSRARAALLRCMQAVKMT